MKIFLLVLLNFMFLNSFLGQNTLIPDVNFEQALINLGYDTPPINGGVPTANIDTISSIYLYQKNISDLTGIEGFIALTVLYCSDNNLTNLNVSQNVALVQLYCTDNNLSTLNVSQNTALDGLWCGGNQLTNLIVNNNLNTLFCFDNQLTSLNLSQNTNLEYFDCENNQLTCLNIKNGNNTNMQSFYATNNPNLTCIEVDNASWSATNWTDIDPSATFSTNCSNPCIVSIGNLTFLSNLSIFPNPTNGLINIELNSDKPYFEIEVFSLLGELIYVNKVNSSKLTFDLSQYPKGMYLVKIKQDNRYYHEKISYY